MCHKVMVGSIMHGDIIDMHIITDIIVGMESHLEILGSDSLLEGEVIAIPAIAIDQKDRGGSEGLILAIYEDFDIHILLIGGEAILSVGVIIMIEPERENRVIQTGDIDLGRDHASLHIEEICVSHEHTAIIVLRSGEWATVLIVGLMAI